MNENKYFLHQIKHTGGAYEKGIVIKDTLNDALQSFHAYLGAYAYGHDNATDMVSCLITDSNGAIVTPYNETWKAPIVES